VTTQPRGRHARACAFALLWWGIAHGALAAAPGIVLQAEDFHGTWNRQTNIPGYLGKSFCTSTANPKIASSAMTTTATLETAGRYFVWVRAFTSANSRRALQIAVNGTRLARTHHQTARRWSWQFAGPLDLPAGPARIAIHDADVGYECADTVYLTTRKDDNPADNRAIEPESLDVLDGRGAGLLEAYLMGIVHQQYVERRKELAAALKSPEATRARNKRLLATYHKMLGPWPEKTPLNATVAGVIPCDGYRIEKVAYESRPHHRVTANLYVPTTGTPPFRAVLVACGHARNAKAYAAYQSACILFARNGLVALIYDPISQGERHQRLTRGQKGTANHTHLYMGAMLVGRSVVKYEAWDGIRGIDYLLSRPEVDPHKPIGLTGNSGGGTQATFLMPLDDRILPAAPSCYVMTQERKFITRTGPADGCQHLPSEGAHHIDHVDYILMRAPRPTRILAADKDYFDIHAVREAAAEAKRAYSVLGCPERVDLFSYNDKHGFSKPRREMAVQWMRRWLLDDPRPVVEATPTLQKERDLWVTTTGQVKTHFPDELSVGQLNLAEAQRLAAAREAFWKTHDKAACLAQVRRLIGLRTTRGKPTVHKRGVVARKGYRVEKLVIRRDGEPPLPALLAVPAAATGTRATTLHVDGRGKAIDTREGGAIETLVRQGRIVLSIDARGFGETASSEYRAGMLALHIGRPLLGQRVDDVLTALDVLLERNDVDAGKIDLLGVGTAGPVALHGAALDRRFASLTLRDSIRSWVTDVVARPRRGSAITYMVPSALLKYDLPHLVAAIAPRPVRVE